MSVSTVTVLEHRMYFTRFMSVLALSLCALSAWSATIICNSTEINSPSFHPKERGVVNANGAMKIKWWEQFGLVKFDISKIKGKNIKRAWLELKAAGRHKYNLNKGTDLTWISVTTVATPWNGKKASANSNGIDGHWGWPGARTYDVACGHSHTLRSNVKLEPHAGAHRAELDVAIAHALIADASYGIFIMDGSTYFGMNCMVKNPKLIVEIDDAPAEKTSAVSGLKVTAAPNWAERKSGAIMVEFKTPKSAFSFDINIDGQAIPRWQIPFAEPGTKQSFPIVDLPAGKNVSVEVITRNAAGEMSSAATASAKVSPALTVPKLPETTFKPKAGAPQKLGAAKVYAFPELTMIDPITGEALHEDSKDLSQMNAVWDGSTGTVRLASAKAESVSFQIAIAGAINDVAIEISDLKGKSTISTASAKLWRNWYVGKFSEYALPLNDTVSCPMPDNKIAGQTVQAVTADIHIPKDAKAGLYKGTVTLKAGTETATLKLRVQIYNVTIPDEIFFNPEMNCYAGPGSADSDRFKNSFKIAHYHRSTINRVPYSQNGRVHKDWTPDINADGTVSDWTRFNDNIGPLLDGSLFKDNPRAGIPVASLYLPHFEGWPADYRKYYKPGVAVPNKKDVDGFVKHHISAKPIEEAMDKEYETTFKNCVSAFYKHATDKKWTRTAFQCYLNNKSKYGYTAWTLDEPNIYRDWEALNYWGRLWKEAINDDEVYTIEWIEKAYEQGLTKLNRGKPVFLYRGDISRLTWQGNLSDDLMNIVYLGGGGFDKPRMVKNSKHSMPTIMYAYGRCPDYTNSKWKTAAWCLKAFINESDGVLPWQSLGNGLNKPDPKGGGNALIVNAPPYGNAIASFRVHGFRRGAQDCELLRLLMLKRGWSRAHMGLLVSQKVGLQANYNQAFVDEAADVKFGSMSAKNFTEMKEGVLQLLAK